MKTRILHLFPNLMNLFGDYANITILTRYMNEENLQTEVVKSDCFIPLDDFDMVYIGCGTENSSFEALKLLEPHKEEIKEYIEKGKFLLLTGNAYEIFGKHISDDDGESRDALGIFDYTVNRKSLKRYLGDAIYYFRPTDSNIIGFNNKCGYNDIKENYLFECNGKKGNSEISDGEGYLYKNVVITSLIGPIMVKNPMFCRWYLDRFYQNFGFEKQQDADMSLQIKAYNAAYNELCVLEKLK